MRSPRTLTVLSLAALVLAAGVALPASAVSLHRGEARPPSLPPPSARVAPRFDGDVPPVTERAAGHGPATAALLSTEPTVALQACVDDPSWLCGSVRVPVDRARPRGRSLSVGFSVLPHSDPTATARDAIFVSDGGPGAANGTGKGFRVFQMAPLTDQRDLVLMDNRGTGTSGPIDCQRLQAGASGADDTIAAVGACGRQLGEDADRYGSGDVALDLEAVRQALGYPRIDYYAQSYGSVDIEAYAVRFPHRLRAVVADAGLPVNDHRHAWTWGQDLPAAYARVATLTCHRAPACAAAHPRAGSALRRLATALRARPVRATVNGPDGPRRVTVDEALLAQIAPDVLNGGELAAAATALDHGDAAPLLRLGAEATAGGDPDDPAVFSWGDNAAAFCNDTDFVWDRTDPVAVRRAKFHHAERALGADAFAPFSTRAWREHFITDFCLRWPAPDRFTPAVPPGATATGFPVLLLSGDLDTQVATAISRTLRDTFPQARLLRVAGAAHPAAGWSDCARVAMRSFMRTLQIPASGTCDEPAVVAPAVPQFPRRARAATAARPRPGDHSTDLDHRIATTAVRTVLDGWLRSFRAGPTGTAPGLREGTVAFDYTTFDDHATLSLHRTRFAHNVTVTGKATLTYDGNLVHARARVRGPNGQTGMLTADGAFGFGAPYEDFTVTGNLGHHRVNVSVPAN